MPSRLKLLAPDYEYLTLDHELLVQELSDGVPNFAESPQDLKLGEDVRLAFPELVGMEGVMMDILVGRQISFHLAGIVRADQHHTAQATDSPFYFDLHICHHHDEKENYLILLFKDVTERMKLQQKLIQKSNETNLLLSALTHSKNYIDKIISSMADALLVTTASGDIKTANRAAQTLFGYNIDELVGQPITKIIKNQDFLNNLSHLSPDSSTFQDIELNCLTKQGETVAVAFSCSALITDLEGSLNFVYVGRDLTQRKLLEAEMLQALEREKELTELKSRFISMTSHEFRVPLTAVYSSTELLEQYSSNWAEEKKLKHFNRIKDSVNRMTTLLDDVLIVNKAESGKLEFNPQPLNLNQLCRDLVEDIELGIGKQHKIRFVDPGRVSKACMDEKLLRHILTNLLTNAVKYSPLGSTVQFNCHCRKQEVLFEIKDQGIGIPPEDQKRLFESFHRAKNVGNIQGTGLGLSIVKKSVDLHGGKLAVHSEVGVGTTFKVTLPLGDGGAGGAEGAEGAGGEKNKLELLRNTDYTD
jgi:PAS domain S-box-containing protein